MYVIIIGNSSNSTINKVPDSPPAPRVMNHVSNQQHHAVPLTAGSANSYGNSGVRYNEVMEDEDEDEDTLCLTDLLKSIHH